MIRHSYAFELITPCFCGGANPSEEADIRPASIRGQLRWWFRVLGGFQSLAAKTPPMSLREQEDFIFGAAAGDEGNAGKLMVRVAGASLRSTNPKNAEDLAIGPDDARGYLLFPLRRQGGNDGKRGVFLADGGEHGSFTLHLQWRGALSMGADLRALLTVFGHIGSLGFRSRRAMGALRLVHSPFSLKEALMRFSSPSGIVVFSQDFPPGLSSEKGAVRKLAEWLRDWRQHGRSNTLAARPPTNSGFDWALRDHDEGVEALTGTWPAFSPSGRTPKGANHETFRPALGLPIEQRFMALGNRKAFWDKLYSRRLAGGRGSGRFASPVLLRPHYDGTAWSAYVIFVDARTWTPGEPVFVQGLTKAVSLDLYDAMKNSLATSPAWHKLH